MKMLLPSPAAVLVNVVVAVVFLSASSSAINITLSPATNEKVDSLSSVPNDKKSSTLISNATIADILNARKSSSSNNNNKNSNNRFIVSADEVVSPRTQYLIRSIVKPNENNKNHQQYQQQQQNAYEDYSDNNNNGYQSPPSSPAPAPYAPPPPPSPAPPYSSDYAPYSSESLYDKPKPPPSSSNSYCIYGDVSIGSLGCMHTAHGPNDKCQLDAQCLPLGQYMECRDGKCQCQSGFASVASPASATMMTPSTDYDDPYATPSPYQKPPPPPTMCVPKLHFLDPSLICNINQPCCVQTGQDISKLSGLCQFMFDPAAIKALQQAGLTAAATCALSAGPTGDAVPANTVIDPLTCRITSTAMLTGAVTLTVTATTTVTSPPMQAVGLVTLYPVVGDQCCTLIPLPKTTMFTIQGLVLLLALNSEEQGGLLFFETANLNTPTLFATLDQAFESPCDVPITLVSVSLAPTGASNEFCSLLSINERGVGFFGDKQTTIDAIAALFATVAQDNMSMIVCPISVTVRACNGLTNTAVFLLRSTVYVTPPDES